VFPWQAAFEVVILLLAVDCRVCIGTLNASLKFPRELHASVKSDQFAATLYAANRESRHLDVNTSTCLINLVFQDIALTHQNILSP
jgi:hypothetical protein